MHGKVGGIINRGIINEEKACFIEILCEWLEKDGDCKIYNLHELFPKMRKLNSRKASTAGKILSSRQLYKSPWTAKYCMFQLHAFIYFI